MTAPRPRIDPADLPALVEVVRSVVEGHQRYYDQQMDEWLCTCGKKARPYSEYAQHIAETVWQQLSLG